MTGLPNSSRKTKFSGANGDREIFIILVQLTTTNMGNLTGFILTLAICVTFNTYIIYTIKTVSYSNSKTADDMYVVQYSRWLGGMLVQP